MKINRSGSYLFVVCAVLLIAILIGPVTADTMTTLNCQDLPGSDYSSIPVATATACSDACLQDIQCKAATFVHAQGQTPSCWLKNGVPTAKPAQCDFQLTIHSFTKQTTTLVFVGCIPSVPDAYFTESPSLSEGVVPFTIHFTDTSTGAKSRNWNFGDGSTSTDPNPDHTYSAGSTTGIDYTITLTITGSCPGESDSYSRKIRAHDNVGLFLINSVPSGAKIGYDGTPLSKTTPFIADGWVPIGIHGITLKLDGYDDYFTTFMVEKGKTAQVNAVLVKTGSSPADPTSTTGSLQITSIPDGAAVYIDGGSQGTTPTNISGITAGSHTMKLTKSGYTDYQQPALTITAGKTLSLNINLVAGTGSTTTPTPTPFITQSSGTGSISIISSPSGASVNLDGWDKGTTPVTLEQVKAGSHTLTLTKTGYQDSVKTVPVTGGSTTEVTITLTSQDPNPSPSGLSTLTVRSTPSGANVYIDGETAGITPVKIQNVKAGTHKILLTLQGYSDNSQTVESTAGSDKEISVGFIPKSPGFAMPVSLTALAFTALVVLGRRKGR